MAQSAQVAKVNHWHERFADWLIANPGRPMSEAAKFFGKSQSWLSVVKNSDAFTDYFKARSQAHADVVSHNIKDKILGVADHALSLIGERLDEQGAVLPIGTLLEVADITLKRAGFDKAAAPAVQQNFMVSPQELADARAQMRGAGTKVIELKAETPPAEGVE